MNAINYTELRKNLKSWFDKVYDDHEPLFITRKNNQNIVVISVDEYNSLVETNYLLSNKANADRIFTSLAKLRTEKGFSRELIEE